MSADLKMTFLNGKSGLRSLNPLYRPSGESSTNFLSSQSHDSLCHIDHFSDQTISRHTQALPRRDRPENSTYGVDFQLGLDVGGAGRFKSGTMWGLSAKHHANAMMDSPLVRFGALQFHTHFCSLQEVRLILVSGEQSRTFSRI